MLRKTISVDDQLLEVGGGEQPHLRLLRPLERGRKKACSVQVSTGRITAMLLFAVILGFYRLHLQAVGAAHGFYCPDAVLEDKDGKPSWITALQGWVGRLNCVDLAFLSVIE